MWSADLASGWPHQEDTRYFFMNEMNTSYLLKDSSDEFLVIKDGSHTFQYMDPEGTLTYGNAVQKAIDLAEIMNNEVRPKN